MDLEKISPSEMTDMMGHYLIHEMSLQSEALKRSMMLRQLAEVLPLDDVKTQIALLESTNRLHAISLYLLVIADKAGILSIDAVMQAARENCNADAKSMRNFSELAEELRAAIDAGTPPSLNIKDILHGNQKDSGK